MANELKHSTVGGELTQAEFEGTALHVFNNQAAGDILYASSATQLSRLPIGSGVLTVSGGVPAWSATLPAMTLGGNINANGYLLNQVGEVYGKVSYGAFYVNGSYQGVSGVPIIFRTTGAGGSYTLTARLTISANAATAAANWANIRHIYDAASLPDGDPHAAGQIYYTSADGIVRRSAG